MPAGALPLTPRPWLGVAPSEQGPSLRLEPPEGVSPPGLDLGFRLWSFVFRLDLGFRL